MKETDVVSYWDYLQENYPLDASDPEEKEQNKQIQIDRLLSFAKPGGLASKFKNTYEKMLKALSLPKGAKEELDYPLDFPLKVQRGEPLYDDNETGDDGNKLTEEQKLMMDMFGEGKFHMIPSFFRTLVFNKKQKREFSVIFRSMGSELEKIVWEFNQFCIGQHPCFSGRNGTPLVKFDGSKGTKDLRIKSAN